MNVVLAHDYLTQLGGAERVVLAMARTFPGAPILTSVYEPQSTYPEFSQLEIQTLPIDRLTVLRRNHRLALPLLGAAWRRPLVEADVVVASSSGWAHGVRTSGAKVVYCHAPARWLYQTDRYAPRRADPRRLAIGALRGPLTRWDQRAAAEADRYLANSTVIRRAIADAYGIDAEVLHPPLAELPEDAVEPAGAPAPGYLLTVSRLLPYKNVHIAVELAARRPSEHVLVVGEGPQKQVLQAAATRNLTFLEGLTDAELSWCYRNARALVAASHEDFGLTPLEAAAVGTPAVVLRAGGYLDTVVEGVTGSFFDELSVEGAEQALRDLDGAGLRAEDLIEHARRFAEPAFRARLFEVVSEVAAAR